MGFGLGSDFLVCFLAEFLTGFSLFGFLFVESDLLISAGFLKTRLSTVVTGFFQSSNLQPRQMQFFTLGARPVRARGVSPKTSACGSRLVFQGAVGGFSVVPRSFDEFSAAEEVSGGGAWSERTVSSDSATQLRSRCWLLF
jgi:hypothetical protein